MSGVPYTYPYSDDLTGNLPNETYPSGRVVQTLFDEANRPIYLRGTMGTVQTNYVPFVHGKERVCAGFEGLFPNGARRARSDRAARRLASPLLSGVADPCPLRWGAPR